MSKRKVSNESGARSGAATADVLPASISEASTVEDCKNDADNLPNDEAYTYLQGLNSDNLMQFSQQSVLQELMLKEHTDVKPNLDVLPTFEEHDIGGYKFQLRTQRKGKVKWLYSESLNKVYIRMNDLLSIDVIYTPKLPMQQLRIRALICFTKEVSEPVLRCQNHMSKDTASLSILRQSLLRCENPSTEYYGRADGKSINDRYSVLVPLNACVKPQDDCSIKQTIALKFMCQNSCIGRKETSVVFLLESVNGEILSQRVLDVRICCCPKRDKGQDEYNFEATKRKIEEADADLYPRAKLRKKNSSSCSQSMKENRGSSGGAVDLDETDSHEGDAKQYDLQQTASGGFRLVIETCSKDVALHGIEAMMNKTAAKIQFEPSHAKRYLKSFCKLKRLYDKAGRLNKRNER